MRGLAMLFIVCGMGVVRRNVVEVSAEADAGWPNAALVETAAEAATATANAVEGKRPVDAQGKAVIIRKGTQGGAVHFLQSMLAMHNYQVKQDGKFGPDTEKAVKEFQESRSLDVDGLVGKETWDKLLTRPKFGPVEEVTEGSSVGELRDALKHADRNVRKAAAEEIWKRGEEAEIALSDLLDVALKDKDEFVSDSAADALGKLGEHMPEAFFQEIAGHLRDGDGVFAGKAGRAADVLGKLGDDVPAAVVDEIVGLLQSSDQKARSAALSTLFRLGANAGPALRHLRKLVQNKHGNVHWTVRSNAIGTIGHLGAGAKLAIGDLCDAMQEDEEWWVRRAAADALGELGEHAVPCLEGLTGALMDEELSVRMGAASALGDLGKHAARSLPMLRAALNDSKYLTKKDCDRGPEQCAALSDLAKRVADLAIKRIERATKE